MTTSRLHKVPSRDPVSGGELHISELSCDDSGVTIRGRFEIPRYSRLDGEQQHFLETFLRCRGMLSSVERELGISYPTVRARLDALLEALSLTPAKEDTSRREKADEQKHRILEELERGEITVDEAKKKLGVLK